MTRREFLRGAIWSTVAVSGLDFIVDGGIIIPDAYKKVRLAVSQNLDYLQPVPEQLEADKKLATKYQSIQNSLKELGLNPNISSITNDPKYEKALANLSKDNDYEKAVKQEAERQGYLPQRLNLAMTSFCIFAFSLCAGLYDLIHDDLMKYKRLLSQ